MMDRRQRKRILIFLVVLLLSVVVFLTDDLTIRLITLAVIIIYIAFIIFLRDSVRFSGGYSIADSDDSDLTGPVSGSSGLEESFNDQQIVFDLVYNPPKSKLLQIAERQGAKIENGLKMLVTQAAKSFELWTGEEMPVENITKSLQLYLTK